MKTLLVYALLNFASADVYLHNPRGSNNRLDETNRERNNANRLFDSQNNARGGYPVGEGDFYYYATSVLPIEWTNQHSCDGPNSHCEMIVQYMCDDNLRDGQRTATIPKNRNQCRAQNCDTDERYGMQENYVSYTNCRLRQRNKGLFVSDQNMNNRNRAIHTRQDRQGAQHGYECPEERDYYPYWHPSQWKDIVVMTNNVSRCEYYQQESQNVKSRWMCSVPEATLNSMADRNRELPNNKADCENFYYPQQGANNAVQGQWVEVAAHGLPPPDCREAEFSRDNHLGSGINGYANKYNWTVPNIEAANCALRMRYNISTREYPGWNTDASDGTELNLASTYGFATANEAQQRGYVLKGDPKVKPFASNGIELTMNVNTDQYGRTFQDRSYKFSIRPRPADAGTGTIYNLNVRGKRGNIVQVYPSVEYDFIPNTLAISPNDAVHFQWTGSDRQPRNNDGEGRAGTDRNNAVLQKAAPFDVGLSSAYPNGKEGHWGVSYPENINQNSFVGFSTEDRNALAALGRQNDPDLNGASPYFDLGVRSITSAGTYHYLCTRNNNFSNRSQKGKIVVMPHGAKTDTVGQTGGKLALPQGSGSIEVRPDSLADLQRVHMEVWPTGAGERQIEEMYGNTQLPGRSYLSNYVLVTSDGPVSNSMTVNLRLTRVTDNVKVYEIPSGASEWKEISEVSVREGHAVFEVSGPGVFVARSEQLSSAAQSLGISSALPLLLLVCVL